VLDFDLSRKGVAPRSASTLIVLRAATDRSFEVFCVQRRKGGFLGGAVVFPGGALDSDDTDPAWERFATPPRNARAAFAGSEANVRGLAVAACREALEEAAILPLEGSSPPHAELLEWRRRVTRDGQHAGRELRALLEAAGLRLDLASLIPFARWITPSAEARRFDTRFFLFVADAGVVGLHDDCETTASFWASPDEILRRYVAGELQLAPPTHRTLEVLAAFRTTEEVVAAAEHARLEAICRQVVTHKDDRGETIAVVLPGDPEHPVREPRVTGKSRFVLRAGRFFPEDPPA
jgi:8-oxo-dGTP pyrophosphatase MutT (NUDIX family)